MGVHGDTLAVEGGEGDEDGDGDEEANKGEEEKDQGHSVDEVVEVDICEVETRGVVCPAPEM